MGHSPHGAPGKPTRPKNKHAGEGGGPGGGSKGPGAAGSPKAGPHSPSATRQLGQLGGTGIQVRPVASWDAGQGVQLLQIQRTPGSPGSARARAASSPRRAGVRAEDSPLALLHTRTDRWPPVCFCNLMGKKQPFAFQLLRQEQEIQNNVTPGASENETLLPRGW